jgi:hypothetical protein
MAQQREAVTDRLVSVIANIKIERRNGRLLVRRGEGRTSEEGALTFVQGQITLARVGRRHGSEALNWLSTWGQTRYVFLDADTPGKTLEMSARHRASSTNKPTTAPLHPVTRVDTDRLDTPYPLAYGIPHATVDFSEASRRIERSGLSRAHRRLYLLIDGQRSAIELVPFLGKQAEEVRTMLYDLEWLGVIRIVNFPTSTP